MTETEQEDLEVCSEAVLTSTYAYACHVCERRYKWKDSLQRHLKDHTGDKRHICSVCDKKFSFKYELQRHEESHRQMNQREFRSCRVCSETFASRPALISHVNRKHKMKFVCNICDKSFGSSFHLKEHMQVHSGNNHQCLQCFKSYKHIRSLKRHQNLCKSITPMDKDQCDACGKLYSKKYMKQHLAIHQKASKHQCSKCGLSFVWSTSYFRHVKRCRK